MSYPLYHSSRIFVTLTMRDNSWMAIRGDDEQTRGQSFIAKYQNHLLDALAAIEQLEIPFSQISLFDMARCFKHSNRGWSRNRKDAIVRIFPKFRPDPDPTRNEAFYRQQVMLHIPWTDENELRENGESWFKCYNLRRDDIPYYAFESDFQNATVNDESMLSEGPDH